MEWSAGPRGHTGRGDQKLNAEFNKVLATPEMRERLLKIGYEPIGGAPDAFSQHIEAQTKMGPVIKQSGLQIN